MRVLRWRRIRVNSSNALNSVPRLMTAMAGFEAERVAKRKAGLAAGARKVRSKRWCRAQGRDLTEVAMSAVGWSPLFRRGSHVGG